MSDPKRMLEAEESSADEKALLCAGLHMDAPQTAVEDLWTELAATPGVSPSPQIASAPTASKVGMGLGWKVGLSTLGLLGAGVAVGLGLHTRAQPQAIVPAVSPVASMQAPSLPVAEVPRAERAVEAPREVMEPKQPIRHAFKAPAPSAPKETAAPKVESEVPPPEMPSTSDLIEESRALEQSRRLVVQGSYSAAMAELEKMEGRFPKGMLMQEREALLVETLWKAGHREKASTLGAAFLAKYPQSPHGGRIRKILSGP